MTMHRSTYEYLKPVEEQIAKMARLRLFLICAAAVCLLTSLVALTSLMISMNKSTELSADSTESLWTVVECRTSTGVVLHTYNVYSMESLESIPLCEVGSQPWIVTLARNSNLGGEYWRHD
jgi:hypothetical protein